MTVRSSSAARMHSVSAVSLTLGIVGVGSVATRLLLDVLRPSDECRTGFTLAIEWLIWIALVSSALALVLGVVALAGRSDRIVWAVLAIGLALVVAVLMFTGAATIVCGSA